MPGTVHAQVLMRAARILGGNAQLRAYLRVSIHELEAWMAGKERAPSHVFLRAVDLISGDAGPRTGKPAAPEQALRRLLQSAIDDSGASKGNVQLRSAEGLRIVAQVGFERPFLDFFALVRDDRACACGRAMRGGQRFVVPDVDQHPIFAGTAAGAVLRDAGVRGVQSTPLRGGSGELVGMLSTHYERPHEPSAAELELIDGIARRAVEHVLAAS